jgi:hypothetical protein
MRVGRRPDVGLSALPADSADENPAAVEPASVTGSARPPTASFDHAPWCRARGRGAGLSPRAGGSGDDEFEPRPARLGTTGHSCPNRRISARISAHIQPLLPRTSPASRSYFSCKPPVSNLRLRGSGARIPPRRSAVRIRLAPSPRRPCKRPTSDSGEPLERAADAPSFQALVPKRQAGVSSGADPAAPLDTPTTRVTWIRRPSARREPGLTASAPWPGCCGTPRSATGRPASPGPRCNSPCHPRRSPSGQGTGSRTR